MKFGIVIRIDGKRIRLQVERIYVSDCLEMFEVRARNKSLTIQSNRPLIKAKGLKTRKPDYKLIAGIIHSPGIVKEIVEALHKQLKTAVN